MNFEAAIKIINRDFCNLFLSKYLQGQWGITAGFNTVPEYLAVMRKNLADWQIANCNNDWCTKVSTASDVTVVSFGKMVPANTCVLNPPLSPGHCTWGLGRFNFNEILIGSFTR